ncbi:MAG: hypothetical protein ABSF53_02685 [Terracidiphilus sp.]
MNAIHLLIGIAGLTVPALAQKLLEKPESLMHVSTSFDLVVHASYAKTAPLFGPNGERAWAGKHWDPEFIHPLPAKDVEGAVFTIQHGTFKAVWVNTLFDIEARHFQYVYFMPDLMVTVIDVRFKPTAADTTGVNIVYTRTALTAAGNEHVIKMGEGDRSSGSEWQKAIDDYLESEKAKAKKQ